MKKYIIFLIIGIMISTSLFVNPVPSKKIEITNKVISQQTEIPIDMDFTMSIIEKLTGIIQTKDVNGDFIYWQGRDFGTPGEREAARILKEEIWDTYIAPQNESIPNAVLDKVEGENAKKIGVESQDDYDLTLYFGDEIYNIPKSEYFPLNTNKIIAHDFENAKVHLTPDWMYNIDEDGDLITEIHDESLTTSSDTFNIYLIEMEKCKETPIYEFQADYSFSFISIILRLYTNADAFLCIDHFEDTHFMTPQPQNMPGMTISGNLGEKIKNNIENNVEVTADFYIDLKESYVESYNVIGTIPGEVEKIVFIGAHYDSVWNQGACDDSCSVAITFAIAKYFADNDIKPYYTLKFAAWAGEEYFFNRGSVSYISKHKNHEDYFTCINFGPTGFKNGDDYEKSEVDMYLQHSGFLTRDAKNKLYDLDYSEISGGYGDLIIKGLDQYITCVDAGSFIGHTSNGVFSFGKGGSYHPIGHYYHRDGANHTKGDTIDVVDEQDVKATVKLGITLLQNLNQKTKEKTYNLFEKIFQTHPLLYLIFQKIIQMKLQI